MKWIWSQCQDQFGFCIRQYTMCFLSILIMLFSLYSTYDHYTKYRPILRFELVPLSINNLLCLIIFLMTFFEQIYSTHLIFLILEIYSYSLFTYTYISMYFRSEFSKKIQNESILGQMKKALTVLLIIFSFVCICGILGVVIASQLGKINCQEIHGLGTLSLFSCLLVFYLVTLYFIYLTRKQFLSQINSINSQTHLLIEIDEYIHLKVLQGNSTAILFTISLLLHFFQILMFYLGTQIIYCNEQSILYVKNGWQLTLLILGDLGQMIPRIAIPLVWVVIPNRLNPKSSFINIGSSDNEQSHLIQDIVVQQKIRSYIQKSKSRKN